MQIGLRETTGNRSGGSKRAYLKPDPEKMVASLEPKKATRTTRHTQIPSSPKLVGWIGLGLKPLDLVEKWEATPPLNHRAPNHDTPNGSIHFRTSSSAARDFVDSKACQPSRVPLAFEEPLRDTRPSKTKKETQTCCVVSKKQILPPSRQHKERNVWLQEAGCGLNKGFTGLVCLPD